MDGGTSFFGGTQEDFHTLFQEDFNKFVGLIVSFYDYFGHNGPNARAGKLSNFSTKKIVLKSYWEIPKGKV